MKKYICIFSCMMALQVIAMDTIEKQAKKLSLYDSSSLSYDQLIADNARHLKHLVDKEREKGSCVGLNKAIVVLLENKQKTYQDGYLSSRCDDGKSRELIVRLTQRPHDCEQLGKALKQGTLASIKFLCDQNPYVINAYSLYPDYGCVASPLHYMLWTCGKSLKWKDVDETITYLLDKGASPNGVDAEGNTPLHKARTMEHMTLLLARGACINARNNEGLTPVMEYVCNQKPELALLLVKKRGAGIWFTDNNNNTLLHHAVNAGMADIIRHMVHQKLEAISESNIFGETPAQLIRGSNKEIKKVVQKYMIAYMRIALDKEVYSTIQYIIEQCPWIDYAPILMSVDEKKVIILKHYLKINLIKYENK